jgi:hypothetical protein
LPSEQIFSASPVDEKIQVLYGLSLLARKSTNQIFFGEIFRQRRRNTR